VVRDGETVALGGLISETKSHARSGIPWASRIPLLGYLFGASDDATQRTELIVLIRPHVVQNDLELQRLTSDLQEQFKDVLPKAPRTAPSVAPAK